MKSAAKFNFSKKEATDEDPNGALVSFQGILDSLPQ